MFSVVCLLYIVAETADHLNENTKSPVGIQAFSESSIVRNEREKTVLGSRINHNVYYLKVNV